MSFVRNQAAEEGKKKKRKKEKFREEALKVTLAISSARKQKINGS